MDRGIRRSFKGSFNHVEVELFAQYLVLSLEQRCEKNLSEGSVRFPKTECQVFERHRYFVQPGSPGPLHDVIERVGGKERVASPIQRKREKRKKQLDRSDRSTWRKRTARHSKCWPIEGARFDRAIVRCDWRLSNYQGTASGQSIGKRTERRFRS